MKAFVLLLALPLLLISAKLGHAEPSAEQILKAVTDRVGDGLRVVDIRHKVFQADDASRGRVSVAGTLETTEPRGRIAAKSRDIIAADIRSLGISAEQMSRYFNGSGMGSNPILKWTPRFPFALIDTVVAKGEKIPFSGELGFLETVDGFDFKGSLSYEVCCQRLSKLASPTALVRGGMQYRQVLANFSAWHTYETVTLPKLMETLLAGFTDGATIRDVNGRHVADIAPFDLRRGEWQQGNILDKNGHYYTTWWAYLPIRITARTDFAVNYDLVPAGAPVDYGMSVIFPYDAKDLGLVCVSLSRSRGSTRVNCLRNGSFVWDGRQYGGLADTRVTEGALSIHP